MQKYGYVKGNFLEMMKALLSYFIEFKENGTIWPKNHLDNYIIKDLN